MNSATPTLTYADFVELNPGLEDRAFAVAIALKNGGGRSIPACRIVDFVGIESMLAGEPVEPAAAVRSRWFVDELKDALVSREPSLKDFIAQSRGAKRRDRRRRLEAAIREHGRAIVA